MRDAYHCAVAGVVMDAVQRASDMVASSSSSDRGAFHLLPALDSAQFEATVDAHRLAKISHIPPVRSPATPSVARGSATPVPTGSRPLTVPHIPPLPLPGFADPLSHEPRMFSATDLLPDGTPARLRPQPIGDSNFSDIEDDGNGDGSAFLSDGTRASVAVPAARRPYMNVVCGAKRDSVRLGRYDHTRRPYVGPDLLAAQIAERRAELVFLRSMWPRGSTQPADVASEATIPTADDETLGTGGSQGVAQAPVADTDAPGTVECEARAGAGDTEGCGMDASDGFEIHERTAASEPGAHIAADPVPGAATSAGTAPPAAAVPPAVDMDTGVSASSPAGTAPPVAERISSFLLHIRRQASGDAVSSFPGMAGGSAEANPHRETRVGGGSAFHFSVVPPPVTDDATMPTASAAANLANSPSPDVAVAAADSAIGDIVTEDRGADTAGPALGAATAVHFPDGAGLGLATTPTLAPGDPVASVSDGRTVRALSEPITFVSDGRPLFTAGTSHQGVAPTLAPGEPIASVTDGRPARALSEPITSVSDGRPLFTAGASHQE